MRPTLKRPAAAMPASTPAPATVGDVEAKLADPDQRKRLYAKPVAQHPAESEGLVPCAQRALLNRAFRAYLTGKGALPESVSDRAQPVARDPPHLPT